MCCECDLSLTAFNFRYQCHICGQFFCEQCMRSSTSDSYRNTSEDGGQISFCKFCFQATGRGEPAAEHEDEKADILVSPDQDRKPISLINFNNEDQNNNSCSSSNNKPVQSDGLAARFLEVRQGYSPSPAATSSCATDDLSPVSFCWTASRSDEEDAEDTEMLFLSPSSEQYQNISDLDSNSTNTLHHDFYNFKSVVSSPLGSPSFSSLTNSPNRADYSLQHEQGGSPLRSQTDALLDQDSVGVSTRPEDLENSVDFIGDLSIYENRSQKLQQPLDFENYGHIWLPPPPDDDGYDAENNFFAYDDEDDNVGDSGVGFSSSSFGYDAIATKEKPNDAHKEPLRAAVHGHFRALVSQLLKGGGVSAENENGKEGWLEIVVSLAWQAANFVRPDTSRGGSMDPGDYVKVKCILSGNPSDSTLIKGVVCTKNIKHKRMTSQYKNPRLLLLGGALEYQKVPNQLASMDALLQQEIDHLKMTVAKIEAHRPNVLLVERSVSSYAQEYLRAKEISLVLNVKRPLLERIARCTGAHIVSSVDNLTSARLGHCEMFRLEKVSEGSGFIDQPNKKSSRTLMFFENCPRRLGCTVLLRGTCREELKKVKHVIQFAVFAAYHLSLETSFLADEGASLPKIELKPPVAVPERLMNAGSDISVISNPTVPPPSEVIENEPPRVGVCNKRVTACPLPSLDISAPKDSVNAISSELEGCESPYVDANNGSGPFLFPASEDSGIGSYNNSFVSNMDLVSCSVLQCEDFRDPFVLPAIVRTLPQHEPLENLNQGEDGILGNHKHSGEIHKWTKTDMVDENASNEYLSTSENHQSILVSLSSRCVLKGTVCERSQLFRIKFYGSFDKPLGRYLRDDLFDQTSCCRSCKEPAEAHVRCYTHQQGALTISVRCLPALKLPGERDGKIWMWHRCLKCADKDGVPPATRRVVMSDAAWGLSFGKFLELSFSNHATANRVASCGHSLQRDCLRYYGFGSMVAFFRYSPIDIFSVHLPPSMLEFSGQFRQQWVRREAVEISNKMEFLYAEVFDLLHSIEQKVTSSVCEPLKTSDYLTHIVELKELLRKERTGYDILLQPAAVENQEQSHIEVDILELNRLRHCLLLDSHLWNRRIHLLDTFLKGKSSFSKVHPCVQDSATHPIQRDWRSESFCTEGRHDSCAPEKNDVNSSTLENAKNPVISGQQKELHLQLVEPNSTGVVKMDLPINRTEGYLGPEDLELTFSHHHKQDEIHEDGELFPVKQTSRESLPSPISSLSDKIDLAWTGTGQSTAAAQFLDMTPSDEQEAGLIGATHRMDKTHYRKVMSPVRVYSFDSASRLQDRIHRKFSPASLHMSSVKSFHASGDFGNLVRDPMSYMLRPHSETSTRVSQKLNIIFSNTPPLISSTSRMVSEGVRLLLPQADHNDIVIAVYDDDPTSIISYVLSSKEYQDFIADKSDEHEGWNEKDNVKGDDPSKILGYRVTNPKFSVWQSFNSVDVDDIQSKSYGSEDALSLRGNRFSDPKRSSHFRVSFSDESSSPAGKVRFSVICYFAEQFDFLRKQCCPNEIDFIRSLSRCRRWNAQGGKSNVYFAKSLDERFIIKQVTKTELESFEKFASDYFKYLTHSISSGSPTCLAKVVGIYQVIIKHLKGGREVKMDLMVMENLFFRRSISRVYDLKGSVRSRYNPDTAGSNKVLLDMNLLETLRTNPIFLGTKAKRRLERAVWNDTAFLASVDVMDYSLLVGVDESGNELVLGIIDFMRQYTWDKHLETWVKASGILGGPKNASPTVISPKQYKKRFRKAMSSYFLTVPDHWSSSS